MKAVFLIACVFACSPLHARVFLTQEQALVLAFPAGNERHTLFLSDAQRAWARDSAEAPVELSVVSYYRGKMPDGQEGWAFFETHTVRTMPETFMTVVDSSGVVRFVEMLSFHEPPDYLPPQGWLAQFRGADTNEKMTVKRGLRNVAGATLTTRGISDGVRRAVAMQKLLKERK